MIESASLEAVVVVGASTAGLAAAETLRKEGYQGELTIVGTELHAPYRRPPLSKQVLAGEWTEERTLLRKSEEIESLRADWRLGVSARGLDLAQRMVRLSDGLALGFDGLVIATGVTPRRLPAGHDLAGVHVLRTLDDARAIADDMSPGRRLVVIGAGFLGCEVAAVARKAGLDVSVVDPLSTPMLRQLGPELGAHVADLHRSHDTRLYLNVGVSSIAGRGGHVTEVRLTDSTVLAADVVLVAIGSTPNTEWLADSGLSLTDGVDCDAWCRAAPGVVVAGDVASWNHLTFGRRVRFEHQTNAIEQGTSAARALLGTATEAFTPIPFFWSDQYQVKINVYGVPREGAVATVVQGTPTEGRFAVVYREGGRMTAVLTWNMPREALKLREQLEAELVSVPTSAGTL